jgi:MrfA Zn-binding domain
LPGLRYLLLHTPAHVLIREVALECGYSAAGIGERIYARQGTTPMAGILLYTAAPDSEGTLGGLVSLGRADRLGPLIDRALDAARLCSSDSLCAEHDPATHDRLSGAACHACLYSAETSCERGNHYLDRALLVDTLIGTDFGFFAR